MLSISSIRLNSMWVRFGLIYKALKFAELFFNGGLWFFVTHLELHQSGSTAGFELLEWMLLISSIRLNSLWVWF
jgi:hypothetical protein